MIKGKKVLIVDDDVTLVEMYVERIKAEGAIMIQATDGVEGIKAAEKEMPDVILLDIMMPKMNGLEALKHLKENEKTAKIPVALLTALSDEQKKNEGIKLGADDYIVKAETLPAEVVKKIDILANK